MDTSSLYYFAELAKDLNMTRTAARLYISQQTLSNHILRLEEQFDTKLFIRKPSLKLTSAGETVLQFANMVNRGYANLQDILSEINHEERGALSFGSSYFKLQSCIPAVLPEFSQHYPHVEVRLTSMQSSQLEQNLLSGNLDLALVSDLRENPLIISEKIFEDYSFLCVRYSLLREVYHDRADEILTRSRERLSLQDFAELPFCLLTTRLGALIDEEFANAQIRPRCHLRTTDIQIALDAFCQQPVAGFSTHSVLVLNHDRLPDDLLVFPFYYKNEALHSEFFLCRHRDRYLAEYVMQFASRLGNFYQTLETQDPRKMDRP